jgi:hypothetical protein
VSRLWAWRCLLAIGAALACDPLDIELFPGRVDAGGVGEAERDDAAANVPLPAFPDARAPDLCLPGAERCDACVAASACPAELRCHPSSGQCVTPCGPLLAACPAPNLCDGELGVCVSCVEDDDCTLDDFGICDRQLGVCVECTNDSHCTDDPEERPVCLTERRICGCETSDDCATGSCDIAEAQCEDEEQAGDE